MNKGELKQAIKDYSKRTDLTDATLNTFVDLATARIGRELRSSYNETYETVTISTFPYTLPVSCRQLRSVDRFGDGGLVPLRSAGVQQIRRLKTTGPAQYYAQRARELELNSDSTGDYQLNYFNDPAALVGDTDTNDVLTQYPNLYLYAGLIEAYTFIRDAALIDASGKQFYTEVGNINTAERLLRAGAVPAVGLG